MLWPSRFGGGVTRSFGDIETSVNGQGRGGVLRDVAMFPRLWPVESLRTFSACLRTYSSFKQSSAPPPLCRLTNPLVSCRILIRVSATPGRHICDRFHDATLNPMHTRSRQSQNPNTTTSFDRTAQPPPLRSPLICSQEQSSKRRSHRSQSWLPTPDTGPPRACWREA